MRPVRWFTGVPSPVKEPEKVDSLDEISDARKFGSYFELIKINKFRYKNPR